MKDTNIFLGRAYPCTVEVVSLGFVKKLEVSRESFSPEDLRTVAEALSSSPDTSCLRLEYHSPLRFDGEATTDCILVDRYLKGRVVLDLTFRVTRGASVGLMPIDDQLTLVATPGVLQIEAVPLALQAFAMTLKGAFAAQELPPLSSWSPHLWDLTQPRKMLEGKKKPRIQRGFFFVVCSIAILC